MEKKGRSVTAEGVAIQRALHQTLDAAPKILEDPIAPLLVDLASETNNTSFWVRGLTLSRIVSRRGPIPLEFTRSITRPQEWKRERLEAAKVRVPEKLIFAPIDFETTSLREGLSASGFDFRTRSFFSLLGVTQYLTSEAIESIFSLVQSLPRGSEIVFEFIVPDDLVPVNEAAVLAATASFAAERGEPWLTRFRPAELRSRLSALGFSQVNHLSPQAANERYFQGRRDDLVAWSAAQIMRAIV